MNDGWACAGLLLAGSLCFPCIYNAIKFVLTKYFKHRLSVGDIYLICEKCTCSIQAVMSFMTGAIIVSDVKDIMVDSHWLTNAYAWFAVPYFMHDVLAMYNTFLWSTEGDDARSLPLRQRLQRFMDNSMLLLAHHIIMPAIIFPIIVFYRGNLGDFFVGAFYMIEVTIPFISARAVLAQLQLKNSPYYIIAALLMLTSFFCARVLIFPYLYWRYAVHAGLDILRVPMSIPVKCNLGCLLILLPQLYWFWLMLRGVVKAFYKMYVRWKGKPHGR